MPSPTSSRGELLRQVPHARLRAAVRERAGVGMLGADRRDRDEARALRASVVEHRGHARLQRLQRAGEVDVEHRLPVVDVEVHEPRAGSRLAVRAHRLLGELEVARHVAAAGDTRRGHHDVQAVVLLDRGAGHGVVVDAAGHVDRHERGPAADALDLRPPSRWPGPSSRSATTTAAPSSAKRTAVARPRPLPPPGHHRHLARQPVTHRTQPPSRRGARARPGGPGARCPRGASRARHRCGHAGRRRRTRSPRGRRRCARS